jgi:Fe-S-cluster containining protein
VADERLPSLGCARCGGCCDPVFLRPEAARVVDGQDVTEDTATVEFAAKHWQKRDERYTDDWAAYDCDMFDRESRLCTAGNDRPPVCRYFPWYHDGPTPERAASMGAYPQCSYLLDVPPAHRPEGARPLIPVEVIRR